MTILKHNIQHSIVVIKMVEINNESYAKRWM